MAIAELKYSFWHVEAHDVIPDVHDATDIVHTLSIVGAREERQ